MKDLFVTVENCSYKTYLIGSMENPFDKDGGVIWRTKMTPELNKRNIYAFDPTKEESQKVGMSPQALLLELNSCVKSATDVDVAGVNNNKFLDLMNNIWRGITKLQENVITKEVEIVHVLGDEDYIKYSDFIIMNYNDGDVLGGTIAEVALAWASRDTPIFLITNIEKERINKSLLYFILDSGHRSGKIFKNQNDLLNHLDFLYPRFSTEN